MNFFVLCFGLGFIVLSVGAIALGMGWAAFTEWVGQQFVRGGRWGWICVVLSILAILSFVWACYIYKPS